MDCVLTSPTLPSISSEPSLNTREFCIVKGMTTKKVLLSL